MVGGSYRVTGAGGLMTSLPPQAAHQSLSHPFSVSVSDPFSTSLKRASRALQRNLPIKTKDTQALYRENVSIVFQPLLQTSELNTQIAIECFCMVFQPFF